MKIEYKKLKQIGNGSFATIWLAQNEKGNEVILKKYASRSISEARREFLFLSAINSPNVVKAVEFINEPPILVQEYVEGNSFTTVQFKTIKQKNRFLAILSRTLSHLHSLGICYNDLKPENIIIKHNQPVLIDLGLATPNLFHDNLFRGTPAYSAPEKLSRNVNSFATDVFSFGLIALQLLEGILPADQVEYKTYRNLLSNYDNWQNYLNQNVKSDFVKSILSFYPSQRPSMPEIALFFEKQSGIDSTQSKVEIIKQHIFRSQFESMKKLLEQKTLICCKEDEPEKIAQQAALWLESENQEPMILQESGFVWHAKDFFRQFADNISTETELLKSIAQSKKTFILLRDLHNSKTRFFDELSRFDNTLILKYEEKSSIGNVTYDEIKSLLQQYQISSAALPANFNAKANLTRIKLISSITNLKIENFPEDILAFLSFIKSPIPPYLLNYIFPGAFDKLPSLLMHPNVSIKNDGLYYEGKSYEIKPRQDLLEKLKSFAVENDFLNIAIRVSLLLQKQKEALELLEKYVTDLIAKEYYSSAFEILNIYSKDFELTLNLQKKQAFLLRKNGYLKESLKQYEEIKVEPYSLEYAVIASDRAVILQEMKQLEAALEIYNEVLPIFKKQENKSSYLRTMNNIGVLQVQSRQFRDAEKTFLKLNEESTLFENKQFTTMSHLNLADVYLRQGEWRKSLYQAQTAAEFGRKYGRKNIEIWAQIFGIQAQWALGSTDNLVEVILTILADENLQEQIQLLENYAINMLPIFLHLAPEKTAKLRQILTTSQLDSSEKKQALFWSYYRENNFLKATEMVEKMHDPAFKTCAEALLAANEELLTTSFRNFGLQNDCFFYLQNATLVNLNNYFLSFKVLQNEIKTYLRLHPFQPLLAIFEKSKELPDKKFLDILWEIISKIHNNDSFETTMHSVLIGIIRITDLERAVYYKFDNGDMFPVMGINQDLNPLDLDKIRVSTTVLQETIKLGQIRFFEGLQEETSLDIHSSIFGLGLRSAVCYPIIVNNEIRGVIYADATDAKEFSSHEQSLMETLFVQSRAALEKVEKIETLLLERAHFSDLEESSFPEIIGRSQPMRKIFSLIKTVGSHNVNVLISGPTGSGKELIAKALHREYNPRAPFVAVNCAAIPENLLESELFGYSKGAFTGAVKDTKGKIEAANNGTLFLDEIGDMPQNLQAKLLRVLQDRIITPLGSNREIPVSFRIITATNKDLKQQVTKGLFREDLYFRLNVVEIELPPLSERKEDILPLAEHFLKKFNQKFGKQITQLNAKTANKLMQMEWRGNVRELENVLEKAVLLSSGNELNPDILYPNEAEFNPENFEQLPLDWNEYRIYRKRIINNLDIKFARNLLDKTNGNINKASRLANIPRPQIYRILKQLKQK